MKDTLRSYLLYTHAYWSAQDLLVSMSWGELLVESEELELELRDELELEELLLLELDERSPLDCFQVECSI